MKLLYKCRRCQRDRTSRAFVKGHEYECRRCMKEHLKIIKWEVKEYRKIPNPSSIADYEK